MLSKLEELIALAKRKKTKKLAVAAAENKEVLEAVKEACDNDIISPILIGDQKQIEDIAASIGI